MPWNSFDTWLLKYWPEKNGTPIVRSAGRRTPNNRNNSVEIFEGGVSKYICKPTASIFRINGSLKYFSFFEESFEEGFYNGGGGRGESKNGLWMLAVGTQQLLSGWHLK